LRIRTDLHPWPQDAATARSIQKHLPAPELSPLPARAQVRFVLGLDCAFPRSPRPHAAAAAVLWDAEGDCVLWRQRRCSDIPFPYRTGLLAFREVPLFLSLLSGIRHRVDAILVDGQGIAHPKGIGAAAHLALWLQDPIPVVGVGKSRLVGSFPPLSPETGAQVELVHRGRVVGAVLRSRSRCRPLFISPGGHVDVTGAVAIVRRCLRGRRLPEPLRLADHLSRSEDRAGLDGGTGVKAATGAHARSGGD